MDGPGGRPLLSTLHHGWWLSLVERCVRDAEVGSSNLPHPTTSQLRLGLIVHAIVGCPLAEGVVDLPAGRRGSSSTVGDRRHAAGSDGARTPMSDAGDGRDEADDKVDAAGVTEVRGIDIDGDGEVDAVEVTTIAAVDVDGDGVADAVAMRTTTAVDVDGDGVPDVVGGRGGHRRGCQRRRRDQRGRDRGHRRGVRRRRQARGLILRAAGAADGCS